MALILQNCRLLHTPKTGGSWANAAVKRSGCAFAETPLRHVELDQCPGLGLFTIAFVRHPWHWWRSYWLFKRSNGWDLRNGFDVTCMDNHFERFLINVLEHAPGHCSRVFQKFVGREGHEISFVGLFEQLEDDLVRAMHAAGQKFDEQKLRETPRRNVGDYKAFSTRCSPEIRARIVEAEQQAFVRFNYGAAG